MAWRERGAVAMIGLAGLATAPALAAPQPLGVFEAWGAFREERPVRCYAIAEPERRGGRNGEWRAFAAVSHWPGQRVRGQVHFRLREQKKRGEPVWLTIGDRRFPLVAGRADAWAPDPRADAAIVAAIRSGAAMKLETRSERDRPLVDIYRLRGAATAIDAAALGCARRG